MTTHPDDPTPQAVLAKRTLVGYLQMLTEALDLGWGPDNSSEVTSAVDDIIDAARAEPKPGVITSDEVVEEYLAYTTPTPSRSSGQFLSRQELTDLRRALSEVSDRIGQHDEARAERLDHLEAKLAVLHHRMANSLDVAYQSHRNPPSPPVV